ncbi:hypothetical protein PMAYCL1PPCAC_00085, partial [Pristionchus mayeri]
WRRQQRTMCYILNLHVLRARVQCFHIALRRYLFHICLRRIRIDTNRNLYHTRHFRNGSNNSSVPSPSMCYLYPPHRFQAFHSSRVHRRSIRQCCNFHRISYWRRQQRTMCYIL